MPVASTRRSRHDPPRDVPEPVRATSFLLSNLTALEPIPGPKPWTDELERVWIFRTSCGTPMAVAGVALGIPESTVKSYLSDDYTDDAFVSARRALLDRLKTAEAIAHDEAVSAVKSAWGKAWQSAAWFLERKHGYIVQQQVTTGPATVVNIGQLIQIAAPVESLPIRKPVVDAEAISVQSLVAESSQDYK